ncbi:MAG TPA: hypothetical protein VF377_09390 [Acidimicrobiia bacterium]
MIRSWTLLFSTPDEPDRTPGRPAANLSVAPGMKAAWGREAAAEQKR